MPASEYARLEDRSQAGDRSAALLLTELYPPAVGGSAVLFHEIYRRLEGVPVTVITEPRALPAEAGDGPRQVTHPIATPEWGLRSLAGARHHWSTARAVRRLAAGGVVHCARALPEGLAAWMASQAGGPAYICWSHGEDLVTARSSREFGFLTGRVLRRAAFAVANSRNTASLIAGFGVPDDRIKVIYPGVDATRFSPDVPRTIRHELGLRDEHTVLLSVGRFQRRKGHDLAIRAVARLRESVPMLRYVVVGDGEDRHYLEGIVAACGVGDMVRMVGEVPADRLPGYYAAADAFLLPNRIEQGDIEGFGIVFLEAASTGLPVIAGRSGGVPEAVAEGTTGLLVSGTDEHELAQTIASLVADPCLRRSLGLAGRQRVLASFTWDRAAEAVTAMHRLATAH